MAEDRCWAKSIAGEVPREWPREGSFAAAAIDAGQTLVLVDAALNPAFSASPLVTGQPQARFYMGVPLRAPGGERVGVLEVLSSTPREPHDEELGWMIDLSRLAERELGRSATGSDILELRGMQDTVLQLATLMNLTEEVVTVLDESGRVVFWNKRAAQTYGRSRHEAAGRLVQEVITTESAVGIDQILERVLADGRWHGELLHRGADGALRLMDSRWSSERDPAGRNSRWIVQVAQDITSARRRERELRRVEERYRAVLDNSADAILLGTGSGRMIHVNQAGCELLKGSPEELMRESAFRYLDPISPATAEFRAERARSGRARADVVAIRLDGSHFPAEVSSSEFTGADGEHYVSTFMRDLTDRRRVEAALFSSERRLRSIFENAPLGIARISADWRLIDANPRLFEMLQTEPTRPGPVPVDRFPLGDVRATGRGSLRRILEGTGEQVQGHQEVVRLGGTSVWLQWTANAVRTPDGAIDYVLFIVEDVTAKHDAEAAAAATLATLERLNQLKSEFISLVSHEFRTALTGIQGFSELIRDEDLDRTEIKEFAGDINKDALRLARMITEMLDLDRMEAGRLDLHFEPMDLNRAIVETVDRTRAASPKHRFLVELDPGLPPVMGDMDRLLQVLSNLLSNAVKYSPAGGEVSVRSRLSGDHVEVSVSDQGHGIPPEFVDRVFERYERYEAGPAGRIIGTGLGLPIARQIVEMHGGRIWLESTVGTGSTFHFSVPVDLG